MIPKLLKQDGIDFIAGYYFLQFMIEGRKKPFIRIT